MKLVKSRWVLIVLGVALVMAGASIAFAGILQVSRKTDANLVITEAQVLSDEDLGLYHDAEGKDPVASLTFVGVALKPPLRSPRRLNGVVYVRNESDIDLSLVEPCGDVFTKETDLRLGSLKARVEDLDGSPLGFACDQEVSLAPEEMVKLVMEFDLQEGLSVGTHPFSVVFGAVGVSEDAGPAPDLVVTKTEDTDGTCEPNDCSLREAVKAAGSGDTISVPAGTYTLTFGSELDIDKSMTVAGEGADKTIIQAATEPKVVDHRVFNVTDATAAVAISGVTIRHGHPKAGTDHGGAILNHAGASLTVTDSVVTNNTANCGGGISNAGGGAVDVFRSTFTANTSTDCGGGGLINHQNAAGKPRNVLTIIESTVSGNHSNNPGGGLWNGGTLTVTNSTVSGNTARFGGALYNFSGSGNQNATATFANSTVTGNSATSSKGGLWNNKTIQLTNTILAGNTAPSQPDCNSFTSLGHNLIGNNSGCSFTPAATDVVNGDPKLGPLQDNGGLTFTHALLEGSQAIDTGNPAEPGSGGNACEATDQRGVARPVDGDEDGTTVCDIGAYEAEFPPRDIVVTKTEDTDAACIATDCSLREAIAAASSGDTVVVPAGTYTLTLGIELTIDKSLTVDGAGADKTIIQAATEPRVADSRVFKVNSGTVTISGVSVRHGKTSAKAAGISNFGTLTLTNSTVSNNTGHEGAGIYNNGTLTVTESTVSDNEAVGGGSRGGGIYNAGTLTLSGSTVSSNSAGGFQVGGGIYNGGSLTITNSTISGNSSAGIAVGIYNDSQGTLNVNSSTIVNNRGEGIRNASDSSSGALRISNSIVSNNIGTTGGNCAGIITSIGHNLVAGDGTCVFTATGDITLPTDTDAKVGPLQDNGGPTFTHELLSGGQAIDAGNPAEPGSGDNACEATDQRGGARPLDGDGVNGAICDIGAYEFDAQ